MGIGPPLFDSPRPGAPKICNPPCDEAAEIDHVNMGPCFQPLGVTINVIALRYRVRPADIVVLNSLANGGRAIYPGQELIIPFAS